MELGEVVQEIIASIERSTKPGPLPYDNYTDMEGVDRAIEDEIHEEC